MNIMNINNILQFVIPTIISLVTLITAVYIPISVAVNQILADLISGYRSPEMGAAILALFNFFANDCQCDVNKIEAEYMERYEKEIKNSLQNKETINYPDTLHFQRRLVTHFYFNMAILWDRRCLFPFSLKKKIRKWFTLNDEKLLGIILHMTEPAKKVFIEIDNLKEPAIYDEVPMNKLIFKLYKDVKKRK